MICKPDSRYGTITSRCTNDLDLTVHQGVAFTTPVTRALLHRFTQILKDIVNGVPTAYNDLTEVILAPLYIKHLN